VDGLLLERRELLHALLTVLLEECLVLLVFKVRKVRKILALKAVLVGKSPRLEDGFLNQWGWGGRLLGDDAVFTEDFIPA